MSGLFRLMVIVVALCMSSVTGIEFTVSSNQVDPANTLQPIFWMNCTAASLTDVNSLFLIRIARITSSSTDKWETIATVVSTGAAVPAVTDLPNYWATAQVSGSLYPVTGGDHPVTDSYLKVGVDASRLTCSDASTYHCVLHYVSSATQEVKSEGQNSYLTITAQPSTPELTATNGNTNWVFYNVGSSSDNPADMNTGEQLEISCTADIGSDSSRTIQWSKSSEVGTGGMIQYNGYVDEGTAAPITGSDCRYTRTSTMRYITTVFDSNRDSANRLRFLCIVNGAPTDRNRTFYVRVAGGSNENHSVDTADNQTASFKCYSCSYIMSHDEECIKDQETVLRGSQEVSCQAPYQCVTNATFSTDKKTVRSLFRSCLPQGSVCDGVMCCNMAGTYPECEHKCRSDFCNGDAAKVLSDIMIDADNTNVAAIQLAAMMYISLPLFIAVISLYL